MQDVIDRIRELHQEVSDELEDWLENYDTGYWNDPKWEPAMKYGLAYWLKK